MKWNSGKIVLGILLVGILIMGLRNTAAAQDLNLLNLGVNYGANLVYNLTGGAPPAREVADKTASVLVVLGYITAGILVLLGWFLDFALNLGNQVISLPLVQVGSQVVLGFANLGFVLAIIVMAFATIFRVQSYAMKQTLWKLIVAALLVNFSLVIAGGFISVSNSFTNYFQSQSTGTTLATGLAGVLNPQNFLDTTGVSDLSLKSLFDGLTGLFKFIASLFFIIVFSFIIILTFFTLVIMLFIRAIYLGILLVLMPIIWLAWIFPATQKHWQKWWNEFIRWNFFAPAVLFFIFLIIKTGNRMNEMTQTLNTNASDPDFQRAFANMTINTNFFQYAAQSVIGCGLLLGGLYAANSLGITFASTAYGWAQSAGKGVGAWMGRKGVRLGTWPLRTETGTKLRQKLETMGAGRGVLGRLATLPARKVGEWTSRLSETPAKYIDDAEKEADKLSPKERAHRWFTLNAPEKFGYLESLRKSGDLDALIDAGVPVSEIVKTIEQGQRLYKKRGKNISEVAPVLDPGVAQAIQDKKYGDAETKLTSYLKEMSPAKWSKAQWRDMIKGYFKGNLTQSEWDSSMMPVIARSIINSAPAEGITSMYKSLKEAERDAVHTEMVKAIPGADHASRVANLKAAGKTQLAKFFESNLAADMGLTLEGVGRQVPPLPFSTA